MIELDGLDCWSDSGSLSPWKETAIGGDEALAVELDGNIGEFEREVLELEPEDELELDDELELEDRFEEELH